MVTRSGGGGTMTVMEKPKKETNAIKSVHKEIDDLKSIVKGLSRKRGDSDNDSE